MPFVPPSSFHSFCLIYSHLTSSSALRRLLALFLPPIMPPSPHCWTNMLQSLLGSLNGPNLIQPMVLSYSPHLPIHHSSCWKPLQMHSLSSHLFILLSLSATAITNSSSHPKRNITPTFSFSSDNPHHFWQTVNKLLHRKLSTSLPSSASSSSHTDSFAPYFTGKIHKLRLSLAAISSVLSPHSPSPPVTPPQISSFRSASKSEISQILLNCPNKYR